LSENFPENLETIGSRNPDRTAESSGRGDAMAR
jgi:hypothetical protein